MDGRNEHMDALICTAQALQAHVGKLAGPRDAKVIDHLDDGALRWLAHSPMLFVALDAGDRIDVTLPGGAAGFASGDARKQLVLQRRAFDDPDQLAVGSAFGGLFLVPGLRETLRVNGVVHALDQQHVTVRVHECYMHCAKALIRSRFWDADQTLPFAGDAGALLAASRFLALATSDGAGDAELSPKGDPAGLMAPLAALVHGHAEIAVVHGTAELLADEALPPGSRWTANCPRWSLGWPSRASLCGAAPHWRVPRYGPQRPRRTNWSRLPCSLAMCGPAAVVAPARWWPRPWYPCRG